MGNPKKSDISESQQNLLRQLPGVDAVLEIISQKGLFPDTPKRVVTRSVREAISRLRYEILSRP
ncbi:MAG: hypothetical protein ACLFNS_13675, partial [Desulfobacterales bacterium]